jgi:hypothetical protein
VLGALAEQRAAQAAQQAEERAAALNVVHVIISALTVENRATNKKQVRRLSRGRRRTAFFA